MRREAQVAVALAPLEVLVAGADDPGVGESPRLQREGHCADGVVGVDDEVDGVVPAGSGELVEVRDDAGVFEQHGGHHHGGDVGVGDRRQPLGERVDRPRRHDDDVEDPRLGEPG